MVKEEEAQEQVVVLGYLRDKVVSNLQEELTLVEVEELVVLVDLG
mgnify:CR=1 FL=1